LPLVVLGFREKGGHVSRGGGEKAERKKWGLSLPRVKKALLMVVEKRINSERKTGKMEGIKVARELCSK